MRKKLLTIVCVCTFIFIINAQENCTNDESISHIKNTTEEVCEIFSKVQAPPIMIEASRIDKDIAAKVISEDIEKNTGKRPDIEAIKNEIQPISMQLITDEDEKNKTSRPKGEFIITWGYHKGWIGKSDVRFSNPDGSYDFVAHDVTASDRPGMHEVLPRKGKPYMFDVPQYQVSLRYLIPGETKDKFRLGFKLQQIHSKYLPVLDSEKRFTQGQDVFVVGKYFDGTTDSGIKKVGTYDTVYWEYTDGLNEVTAGAFLQKQLLKYKKFQANATVGLNMGFIIPATYSVRGTENRDAFNLSGVVGSVDSAVQLVFFNKVFLEGIVTGSRVNVTNGRLPDGGRIQQKFNHLKCGINLGVKFTIGK